MKSLIVILLICSICFATEPQVGQIWEETNKSAYIDSSRIWTAKILDVTEKYVVYLYESPPALSWIRAATKEDFCRNYKLINISKPEAKEQQLWRDKNGIFVILEVTKKFIVYDYVFNLDSRLQVCEKENFYKWAKFVKEIDLPTLEVLDLLKTVDVNR